MLTNSTKFPFVLNCLAGEIIFPSSKEEIVAAIITVIINIVTAILGTLANGLVIIAYCRNPRLRTIQNTIFFLLAITDVSVTAFVQPTYAIAFLTGLLEKHDCLLWDITTVLSWLFLGLSLVTVVILNLQNYITLAYPYRFQSLINKSCLAITVVFSWVFIAAAAPASVMLRHISLAGYICVSIISLTIISVILTWIWTYKLVSRHRRVIQTIQTLATHEVSKKRKILRSTVTALMVTISLFGCYCLGLFFTSYSLISSWKMDRNMYLILVALSWTLMYLNSLLNPCLLFWRRSNFRVTVRNIFT